MNAHDDLEAFVLGALDADDAVRFDAHLSSCAACREGVASYAAVLSALRRMPLSAPPPAPAVRPHRLPWLIGATVAAILAIDIATRVAPPARNSDAVIIANIVAGHPREIVLGGASAATGSALVGGAGPSTAFVVRGLPPPAGGRGYQVWVRGASTRSPGMLHRTADGLEVLIVPGDVLAGAKHVGVTIEPAGGSPVRTGPAQVTGTAM